LSEVRSKWKWGGSGIYGKGWEVRERVVGIERMEE